MDDSTSYFKPKRLTKQPPPNSATSRMSQASSIASSLTQLRRHPSAPQSPGAGGVTDSHEPQSRDRQRTQSSSHASSTSSPFHPSPNLAASTSGPQSQPESYPTPYRYSARPSLNEKSSDEVIGTPSDSSDLLSNLDSARASAYQSSARRPGPSSVSHTPPDAKMMSPALRQSASFSVGDRSRDPISPHSDSGLTTPKRYSDEAKNAAPWKKKSGFSSFMNSVLGSPRNVKISAPENPVHVTHVGFDNETGQFTVRVG